MKKIILLLSIILLSGCNTSSTKTTKALNSLGKALQVEKFVNYEVEVSSDIESSNSVKLFKNNNKYQLNNGESQLYYTEREDGFFDIITKENDDFTYNISSFPGDLGLYSPNLTIFSKSDFKYADNKFYLLDSKFDDVITMSPMLFVSGVVELVVTLEKNYISELTVTLLTGKLIYKYSNYGNVKIEIPSAINNSTTKVYDNSLIYQVNSNNTISIFGANTNLTSIAIPSTIEGMPVTTLGIYAFYGCAKLKNVNLPIGLKTIAFLSFIGCTALTSIDIPKSVDNLMSTAFVTCRSLMSININVENEGYKSIDGNVYSKDASTFIMIAPGKTTFTMSRDTTIIGNQAFAHNNLLKTIDIPDGIEVIESRAFYNMRKLEKISIPKSVIEIEAGAFSLCLSLNSISVDVNNEYYKSIDGNLYDYELYTFIAAAPGKTNIVVNEETAYIGSSAFEDCIKLENVQLPKDLYEIEGSAFAGCRNLKSITIPDSVEIIDYYAFENCIKLEAISISTNVRYLHETVFNGCSKLISINVDKDNEYYKTIKGNVYSKDGTVFRIGAPGKEIITIENGVTILDCDFQDNKILKIISIPSGVTAIDAWTFYGCTSLTTINLPNTISSIGSGAFAECASLKNISVPNSVVEMGSQVFYGWTSSQTINIQGFSSAPEEWSTNWNASCNARIVWNA